VEWARCPGEFAPQIKLILNSTLVKITWSTFPEGDIKLVCSIINRYQGTQDKLNVEHLEILKVMVRREELSNF